MKTEDSNVASLISAILLVSGLSAWTVMAFSLDMGPVGSFHDDGIYLVAAQSLRDGKGFGLTSRPGTPPPKYPIGFPALIAVALKVVPISPGLSQEISVARAVVLASGCVFFGVAFHWLRRVGLRPIAAVLVVLSTAFHLQILTTCAASIWTELPFCAATYLLLARWSSARKSAVPSYGACCLVDGILAGAGYLIRSNGIALLLAASLRAILLPRRWRNLISCALGFGIVVVPLSLYPRRHARLVPSGDYLLEMRAGWSSLAAGGAIVASNVGFLTKQLSAAIVLPNLTGSAPVVRLLASLPSGTATVQFLVSAIVLVGVVRLARASRRADAPAWCFAVATLLICFVWPWTSILLRLLVPLFPMVILSFYHGTICLARRVGTSTGARARLGYVILLIILIGNMSLALRHEYVYQSDGGKYPCGVKNRETAAVLEYLRTRLEPDAVVASTKPELVYLYAHKQAFPLNEDDDILAKRYGRTKRLLLWLGQVPGRPVYVVVHREGGELEGRDSRQAAALAAEPSLRLQEVFRTPGAAFRVLKLVRR